MSIARLDDCIYQFMHRRYTCSFERAVGDLIASGDNVEVRIGNDEPFYSKVEIFASDEYGGPLIPEKLKIKHLTLYTEEQIKEILKDE